MNDSAFHFKHFTIHQEKCAMKVGTDGVLLGAWTQAFNAKTVLDIGTGTGLIALMLAQKSEADIDAIDIDKNAFEQAVDNASHSKWKTRIQVFHLALQDFVEFSSQKYDLIVSNPPYFVDASKASSEARNIARHMNETLTFEELISGVKSLLHPKGRFCLILPYKEGMLFIEEAEKQQLYCNRITRVRTKFDKMEKRFLMECSLKRTHILTDELIIHEDDNSYTKDYLDLTKDYYIGLVKAKV